MTINFNRIKNILNKYDSFIINHDLMADINKNIPAEISDKDLFNYIGDYLIQKQSHHPDFYKIGSYIIIDNLHNNTSDSMIDNIEYLYENNLINDNLINVMRTYKNQIQAYLKPERDYLLDYFGLRTLERSYLLKVGDKIIEQPQQLFMRIALGIHLNNLDKAFETYDMISQKYAIHASPTIFNIGTKRQQLSSCFLIGVEDNIESIFKLFEQCGFISKWAGGIGIHISSIRGKGSIIKNTGGRSTGIIPMCIVLDKIAKFINQGGKRNGSIAVYLEPWHTDIYEFCELRLATTTESNAARDLFLALWIPDLFMKRVENNETWSLMCPDKCPNLNKVYGEEFDKLYLQYETEGKYIKQVNARELMIKIMTSQVETGMPYMLYKDACNNKSNQKNLGTIRSSNLCVSGDTNVLTKQGNYKISELENKKVEVWNGKNWSETTIYKTGDNKELLEIKFSNNKFIKCTAEHHFYVNKNNNPVHAKNLKINDVINEFKLSDNILQDNIKVIGIYKLLKTESTYCFTEKQYGKGVFNNILTGQCSEIVQYSDENEIAVCNLASISLPKFINSDKTYDFDKLGQITRILVRNLNIIIDINYYPVPEAANSNNKHRPLGIGVQGLGDTFNILNYPFDSQEARLLNKQIFETIYYHAWSESCAISKETGKIYSSFNNSPISEGILQFDMWNINHKHSMNYDWNMLKNDIKKYGVINSLITTVMPTVGTSQILGNSDCTEPYISNIYIKTTLAGEFVILNHNLQNELIKRGIWTDDVRKKIIIEQGSIQNIDEIDDDIKQTYKNAFELGMKTIIDLSIDRAPYIDQSQSLNLFINDNNMNKLYTAHMYGWKNGLKTGMYYLRSKAGFDPMQFGIDVNEIKRLTTKSQECKIIRGADMETCVVCSG